MEKGGELSNLSSVQWTVLSPLLGGQRNNKNAISVPSSKPIPDSSSIIHFFHLFAALSRNLPLNVHNPSLIFFLLKNSSPLPITKYKDLRIRVPKDIIHSRSEWTIIVSLFFSSFHCHHYIEIIPLLYSYVAFLFLAFCNPREGINSQAGSSSKIR